MAGTVLVGKLDRLGRDTLHILETVKSLTYRDVALVSVADGIDLLAAAGRMMIGVLGSFADTSESRPRRGPHSSECLPAPTARSSGVHEKSLMPHTSQRPGACGKERTWQNASRNSYEYAGVHYMATWPRVTRSPLERVERNT